GSQPPKQLTTMEDDTFVLSWTRDSKSILIGHDKDGDERETIYKLDIESAPHPVRLSDDHPEYFIHGGQLHPNNKWLVYGANYDFAVRKEIEPTWIYRQDLQTGERRVLAKPVKGGYVVPDLNDQGTWVLYNR